MINPVTAYHIPGHLDPTTGHHRWTLCPDTSLHVTRAWGPVVLLIAVVTQKKWDKQGVSREIQSKPGLQGSSDTALEVSNQTMPPEVWGADI